jgi:drug/metabolite transporter (DMT)-like permease
MAGDNGGASHKRCGFFEVLTFLAAIVTGTACSICSKTMMQLHGTGSTGEDEIFTKPIFQTFGMFVGMLFGLVMHWAVLVFKIPFPGYEHEPTPAAAATTTKQTTTALPTTNIKDYIPPRYGANETDRLLVDSQATPDTKPPNYVPIWMYFFLAVPAIFDLGATALCMMGLRYLDVSIYQLLRGSGIIFVALMKQHVLGDHLFKFQWLGVIWNVVSVVLVGSTAVLNSQQDEKRDPGEALLGVMLVMVGAFVQALQFVFEEKVMTMDEASAPPLLLIGMEGFWGTVICLGVVYPLAYYLPGEDHGSYEDPWNTWYMFIHSPTIQYSFVLYFIAIFGYNMFAVLVTFALNSIWHAILDNFRYVFSSFSLFVLKAKCSFLTYMFTLS